MFLVTIATFVAGPKFLKNIRFVYVVLELLSEAAGLTHKCQKADNKI